MMKTTNYINGMMLILIAQSILHSDTSSRPSTNSNYETAYWCKSFWLLNSLKPLHGYVYRYYPANDSYCYAKYTGTGNMDHLWNIDKNRVPFVIDYNVEFNLRNVYSSKLPITQLITTFPIQLDLTKLQPTLPMAQPIPAEIQTQTQSSVRHSSSLIGTPPTALTLPSRSVPTLQQHVFHSIQPPQQRVLVILPPQTQPIQIQSAPTQLIQAQTFPQQEPQAILSMQQPATLVQQIRSVPSNVKSEVSKAMESSDASTNKEIKHILNHPIFFEDIQSYWLLNPLDMESGKDAYVYFPETKEYYLFLAGDNAETDLFARRSIPIYRDLVPFQITQHHENSMNIALVRKSDTL